MILFLQALESLLRHIQDIVEKHTNSEVLENCSKVLENFCNEDYGIARKCNVSRSTLIDKLVEKYKDAFQSFFQEVGYFSFSFVSRMFFCSDNLCKNVAVAFKGAWKRLYKGLLMDKRSGATKLQVRI